MFSSYHGKAGWLLMALVLTLTLASCAVVEQPPEAVATPGVDGGQAEKPPLPSRITEFDTEVPMINVYVTDTGTVEKQSIEDYLTGVLAGEMRNDWPMEALKAQAILARTFTLRFMTEKESKYDGADVSTDIEEAQAYDKSGVNERIQQAIDETRGTVLVSAGASGSEFPYAWFHAHSGGKTALAKEGLDYEQDEPTYTTVADGNESEAAPEDARQWTAQFSPETVMQAANLSGGMSSIEIGEKGESGRALTLIINGESVKAPTLRIAIGSTEMRSTLLDEVKLEDGTVTMSGKGYGHGVGMSQWGAYGMAESGSSAEDIVTHYFKDVSIVKMW
ncbi:MAG: SpoIID/LytB domain-containing protein [Oscillospiraceae bacterium]|jgi:stage II sporulation protein D|nr:SpoIID/LytB domain-containing protein [Oscillospiraceae bacterium]